MWKPNQTCIQIIMTCMRSGYIDFKELDYFTCEKRHCYLAVTASWQFAISKISKISKISQKINPKNYGRTFLRLWIRILLGVQISSVRFLCISKQNEWTDQLKYCPLFFPISQTIFEFHLEKVIRLWRRSNFGANFRFLWKKWTGVTCCILRNNQ